MLLFEASLMTDNSPLVKLSKTQALINKVCDMQDVYSQGNINKTVAGGLSFATILGLALGGLIGSPGLVGFLLLTSLTTAISSYFARIIEESTELKAEPLFGLYQGQSLTAQLHKREKLHWQSIDYLGDEIVQLIEDSGHLNLLLDHVQHANLQLRGVDNEAYDRTYHALMQKVKDTFRVCLPAPETQQRTPTRNPQTQTPRGLSPEPVEVSAEYFDWATITRRPHLFVLGDTGSGKTSLVQWLIKTHYPQSSEVLVLDPHDKKGQWGDFPTIGRGRNFDAVELALGKMVEEMDRRYGTGSYDHPPKILIIEEIPAIAANCKTAMGSIACLTLEARKVGIFLILLSQGWEVDSLGIKGKGSIRQSFLFISLGEFAIKKAKELGLSQSISQHDRPCFVGNAVAIVPELDSNPLAKSEPRDSRELLEFCLDRSTTPEPETRQPTIVTNVSKIDSLDDPTLEDLLQKVLAYAKRKERIKPSEITAGLRSCRGYSAQEILQLFNYLEEAGDGFVRGGEFTPN